MRWRLSRLVVTIHSAVFEGRALDTKIAQQGNIYVDDGQCMDRVKAKLPTRILENAFIDFQKQGRD